MSKVIIILLLFGLVVYLPLTQTSIDAAQLGPVAGPAPTSTPTVTPVSPP